MFLSKIINFISLKIASAITRASDVAANGGADASQVAENVTAGGMKFAFDPEKFKMALSVMGKGMLGIFIVTGVIILSVMLLNKLTSPKKNQQ